MFLHDQTKFYTYLQAYTAFGPTVIQPTWFFAREVFKRVGPYSEEGKVIVRSYEWSWLALYPWSAIVDLPFRLARTP